MTIRLNDRQNWQRSIGCIPFNALSDEQSDAAALAEQWLNKLPCSIRRDAGLLLQYAAVAAVDLHLQHLKTGWRLFSTSWMGWQDRAGIDGYLCRLDQRQNAIGYAIDFSAGGSINKRASKWFVRLKPEWFMRVSDVPSGVFVVKQECFRSLVQAFTDILFNAPTSLSIGEELWSDATLSI